MSPIIYFSDRGWTEHLPDIAEDYEVLNKEPTRAIIWCIKKDKDAKIFE